MLGQFAIVFLALAADGKQKPIETAEMLPVPQAISSFGGAVADGWLYVYGGHIGTAHEHSAENTSVAFRRINLTDPKLWQDLPPGPPLQGVPLVAHKGKLYRIGGLSAHNKKGEPADLESVKSVQCFDPSTSKWSELPPLPEGRSSHDAAILGDDVYVIGGWSLGKGEEKWATSALVLNLTDPAMGWKELSTPPFERRALAVVAARDKIFALGGMTSENTPVGDVHVFEPKSQSWTVGPALPGDGKMAFGMSAWGQGNDLYATTLDGSLYQLDEAGDGWKTIGKLPLGRFFHRLLPAGDGELLVVAGANMGRGHLASVAKIRVR